MNRLIIAGKPSTISGQLADLQRTGLFRNGPPIPSNTTDDELIRDVLSDLGASPRERELAERFADLESDAEKLEEQVSDLKEQVDDLTEYESLYRREVRKASELQERIDQLEDEIAKGN